MVLSNNANDNLPQHFLHGNIYYQFSVITQLFALTR